MRSARVFLTILLSASVVAEESATFTLESGVAIVEEAEPASDAGQSVSIRKTKDGYAVLVEASMPCAGKLAPPWLSVAENPTLVIQKQKSAGLFHSGEECTYRLKIAVAADRLESKQTLYAVDGQEVVGHVSVP